MTKQWRPKNWREIIGEYFGDPEEEVRDDFEAGADAMFNAVINHLKDDGKMATMDYLNGHGEYNKWVDDCFKEE